MAFSVVQHKAGTNLTSTAGGVTTATAWTSNTGAGNLLVAALSFHGNATVTCSTSGWAQAVTAQKATTPTNQTEIWYKANSSAADASPVFTISTSVTYIVNIAEISGVATSSPLDKTGSTAAISTMPQTATVGTTITAASEFVFGAAGSSATSTSAVVTWSASTAAGGATIQADIDQVNHSGIGSTIEDCWALSGASGTSPSITFNATTFNIAGGDVVIATFKALAVAPTITTTAVSDTGPTEITAGGNVTSDGGATVTERGLVWATTANPTTADNKVVDGGSGTGAYTDNIISLTTSNTYHYRAYAINSVGTSYGADIQFTTSGQMLNNYQFVGVGDGMSVGEKIS